MAFTALTLELIKQVLPRGEARNCASRRIMSLGYPDIIATPDELRSLFGTDLVDQLQWRSDGEEILRWHSKGAGKVAEAGSLFSLLGYELDVIDVVEVRGGEMLHDLNEPLPEQMREQYALVVDAGTLEHCFNIAVAARNVAELVAVGGSVIHGNPLNMFNHGFYNFNPTWYHDFYETNGFAVEYLKAFLGASRLVDAPPYKRFRGVPDDSVLLVVAWRSVVQPVSWPVQKKYRECPQLTK